MPQAVAKFVGSKVAEFLATKIGFAAATKVALAAYAVTYVATTVALATAAKKVLGPNLGGVDLDLRREVNLRSAVEPRYVVAGTMAIPGVVAYNNTAGSENQDLWVVLAVAGHECQDIIDVWLDGDRIGSSNITWGAAVTGGKFYAGGTGYVSLYKNLGTASQTVISALNTAFTDIDSNFRGRGVAHYAVKMTLTEASQTLFEGGAPSTYRALVEGDPNLYDPRLQFPGGTVTQASVDQANASYQDYATNPILWAAHYLITHAGFSASSFNWQTIHDEADYCQRGTITGDADSIASRFTCNGLLSLGEEHGRNLNHILGCCNGRFGVSANGLIEIRAGRFGTGANLVTNSEMSNTTGFTKYGTGTMVAASSRLVLTKSVGSTSVRAVTAVSTTAGDVYTARVLVHNVDVATFGATTDSDGSSINLDSDSTGDSDEELRLEFVATGSTTYLVFEVADSSGIELSAEFDKLECYLVADQHIDESWLAGSVGVQTSIPRADRFNSARAFYPSHTEGYKKIQSFEVKNTAFISRDGETLFQSFDLPMTATEYEAQRILYRRILQTGNQIVLKAAMNMKAWNVRVHDFVTVTLAELGYSKKVFRVVNWQVNDTTGPIELTLIEDSADSYADPNQDEYTTRSAQGTITLPTYTVPAPSGLTATSKEGGILLEWTNPALAQYYEDILVYISETNSQPGTPTYRVTGTNYFHKLDNGETRYYWIEARYGDEVSSTAGSVSATAGSVVAAVVPNNINQGGLVDFAYVINSDSSQVEGSNPGEIAFKNASGTYSFWHPDGVKRSWTDGVVLTPVEGTGHGWEDHTVFLMYSDDKGDDRFGSGVTDGVTFTQNINVVPVIYRIDQKQWYAISAACTGPFDSDELFPFTPAGTDCIIASIQGDQIGGDIRSVQALTATNLNMPADGAVEPAVINPKYGLGEFGWDLSNAPGASIEETDGYGGSNDPCLQLTGTSTAGIGTVYNEGILDCTEGDLVVAKAFGKRTAGAIGDGQVGIQFIDVDGNELEAIGSAMLANTTNYRQIRRARRAPADTVGARLLHKTISVSGGTHTFKFDDAKLSIEEEIAVGAASILNGGFEADEAFYTPVGGYYISEDESLFGDVSMVHDPSVASSGQLVCNRVTMISALNPAATIHYYATAAFDGELQLQIGYFDDSDTIIGGASGWRTVKHRVATTGADNIITFGAWTPLSGFDLGQPPAGTVAVAYNARVSNHTSGLLYIDATDLKFREKGSAGPFNLNSDPNFDQVPDTLTSLWTVTET